MTESWEKIHGNSYQSVNIQLVDNLANSFGGFSRGGNDFIGDRLSVFYQMKLNSKPDSACLL